MQNKGNRIIKAESDSKQLRSWLAYLSEVGYCTGKLEGGELGREAVKPINWIVS